jgi:hypothetical protein
LLFFICIHYFPLQAEKRAHHNALERKRRDHIKDSFSSLRDSVPALQGEKVNNSTKVIIISIFTPGSYDHFSTVLEMKIWIYFLESNFRIYFYIFLTKNRKIYWSEQSFTGLGSVVPCSSWGLSQQFSLIHLHVKKMFHTFLNENLNKKNIYEILL